MKTVVFKSPAGFGPAPSPENSTDDSQFRSRQSIVATAGAGLEGMEFFYTLTDEDLVFYFLHQWKKSKVARTYHLLNWFLCPAAAIGVGIAAQCSGYEILGFCFAGAAAYAAMYPWLAVRFVKHYYRGYIRQSGADGIIGPIRLIVNDEGFIDIAQKTRTQVRWQDIHGIEELGNYTFIMVTGISAVILPRNGFQSASDYDTLREFARQKFVAAAGGR